MTLIVPDKVFTEQTRITIKNVVTTISALLAVVLIVGFVLLVQDGRSDLKNIGRYMTYITLSVMGAQIILGIIVKIIFKLRNK